MFMKDDVFKILKSILGVLFFYKILNFTRNLFLPPIFYDIFFVQKTNNVCVIAPYYSKSGFSKIVCEYAFNNQKIVSKPIILDDPQKNCLIVLFPSPQDAKEVTYSIKSGRREIFSGKYLADEVTAKRKVSIATLFKYEIPFLKEWIDYHLSFGVEHFYIYENNSIADERIFKILKPYIDEGKVTHILWPYPYVIYNYKLKNFWPNDSFTNTQLPQVNHAIYKYSKETEWLLCCDVDEYFYSPKYNNIYETINNIKTSKEVSSLKIPGFWYGATDEDLRQVERRGVLNTFTHSEKSPTSSSKCLFNTNRTTIACNHNLIDGEGGEIEVPSEILRFNHYRGLSWKKRTDETFAREIENKDILTK